MTQEAIIIQSYKGPYKARFVDALIEALPIDKQQTAHFIVDARVAELYADSLSAALNASSVLKLTANETAKNLNRFPDYVSHLVKHGLRRDHLLVGIGGGIIQDITCFLAATMLRGVKWYFIPTTLLAQADSCIGSKSSINADAAKNILGTFTPPNEAVICTRFLDTLDEHDLRSGIGEILKVHAIEGPATFEKIARDYPKLTTDRALLTYYIHRALEIKKPYIEEDEFDRGRRNVFNYGHSFGHAIEAATNFAVPHGIAVTMGMDMANFVAMRCYGYDAAHGRMHATLRENYRGFENQVVPLDRFLTAIGKDKKNTGNDLTLILPTAEGSITKVVRPADEAFCKACSDYFLSGRLS